MSAMNVVRQSPQNGLAGLRFFRQDLLAGVVVSLVSLPLSSGIAIASGAPPICGLVSAIIAGLVFPWIGGAYVTIAGPAAGLAPALLAIMIALGGAGDAEHLGAGYPLLLCVILMVGVLQVILACLKLARFAGIIPASVVEGMLAAIGLMIIAKSLPMFFGFTGHVHAHEFLDYVQEVPTFMFGLTTPVFAVSAATLALLTTLGSLKGVRILRVVPPQLIAVVFGAILGQAFYLSDAPGFLITLPSNPFQGMSPPDFGALWARSDLWYVAAVGVITLTMIDGVESLATAMAVDRIDPYHRKSNPNRLLLAMGVANIASSLVGGLTIIPGGVKSKVNVASGGVTLWANCTNALCLIVYLLFAREWINLIPKGVLASVLIYTGWKMCEPLIWSHMFRIGKEQLALFAFTIVVTLCTDLLWGIAAGVAAKYVFNLVLYRTAITSTPALTKRRTLWCSMLDLFRNPVVRRELEGSQYHLYLDKPLVCFNSMKLITELDRTPAEAKSVLVHVDGIDGNVGLIDHTSCEALMHLVEESSHGAVPVNFSGIERMRPLSEHHACVHVAVPLVAV